MLAFVEIPKDLDELDEASQALACELAERLAPLAQKELIHASTDLLAEHRFDYIYVEAGLLKFWRDKKLVRIYSERHFVLTERLNALEESRLETEGAVHALTINRDVLRDELAKDAGLLEKWLQLQDLEGRIMHTLCALYAEDELRPDLRLASFHPGDVIVQEGTEAQEIYVLIEGEAEAWVGNEFVGMIAQNEVFGEMAFFTDQPRAATVKAKSPCLVQSVKRDDFDRMCRFNPDLLLGVAKNLALRLSEMNKQRSARRDANPTLAAV